MIYGNIRTSRGLSRNHFKPNFRFLRPVVLILQVFFVEKHTFLSKNAIFEAFEHRFWTFLGIIFSLKVFILIFTMFWSPIGVEKRLKRYKTLIFIENSSKSALFGLKTSQNGPRAPLEPPRMTKIIFLSCQDMKTTW